MSDDPKPRASVAIAAHNEATVLGATLRCLLADAAPGELEIAVAANGCQDDTATIARECSGVRVLELPSAGKAEALNAAESVLTTFPRIYLDADIELSTHDVRQLCDALALPSTLAAHPERRIDLTGRPLPVRAYFAIHQHLPAFRQGLFGKGVIALSEEGRARFDRFPTIIADDLFLDGLFSQDEKRLVTTVQVLVAAPLRTRGLILRLERVRRGNRQLRAAAAGELGPETIAGSPRSAAGWSWLHDVVLHRPTLAPAALMYVLLTGIAELRARRSPSSNAWGRDGSAPRMAIPLPRPDQHREG
jgi:glycosyltransferase involved in cell wall biosynthesis